MQKLTRVPGAAGSTLVFALVFGIVLSIMGITVLRLIENGSNMSRRSIEVIRSYWANEGALRVAYRYITCVSVLPTTNISPFTTSPAITLNGYTPSVSILALTTTSGIPAYTCSTSTAMTSVGLHNTTVCTSVPINSMQRWAMFEENTSPGWQAMIVNGDYHTNGYIDINDAMSGVAHVTGQASASTRISPTQTYDRPNFSGSFKDGFRVMNGSGGDDLSESASWLATRFPNYAFESSIPTDSITPTSPGFNTADSLHLPVHTDSVAIRLNNANVNIWTHSNSSNSWTQTWPNVSISTITGGIIKSAAPTYVGGTLNGQLTIVTTGSATNDIIVGDTIKYANTNLSTSDDVLALVSANDLVIPNSTNNSGIGMSHSFTQYGGLIDASIFLSNGALNVQNINGYSALRNLVVNGGVVQTSSLSTFSGNKGIEGNYCQDPRYLTNAVRAPGIPLANAQDPERSGSRMFELGNGTWKNTVTAP